VNREYEELHEGVVTQAVEETPADEAAVFITASELLEYLFCPRFIYFMNCLSIDQHQEKRFKVQKGRKVHEDRERLNPDYLRKRIGCSKKEISVYLSSPKEHIKGIVDEVLTLDDGTMAPLDYKFAEFRERVYATYRYQSVFYALLIRENYGKEVTRGYVCYTRSSNLLKELSITERDFEALRGMVAEIVSITQTGFYPHGTKQTTRCIDCCYRKICI
jgi:CRISPR-associated exonuclease Cas4